MLLKWTCALGVIFLYFKLCGVWYHYGIIGQSRMCKKCL